MSTETMTQPDAEDDTGDEFPDEVIRAVVQFEVSETNPGTVAVDDDERTLDRILRRRSMYVAEVTRLKEQCAAMIRDAERKVEAIDWVYTPVLERIVRAKLTGQTKKSLNRPHGKVGLRASGGGLVIVDPDKFIAHAKATPGMESCVREKPAPPPEVAKKELADWFKKSGEVPPGTDVAPKVDRFYID
jgi:hypothetical protein